MALADRYHHLGWQCAIAPFSAVARGADRFSLNSFVPIVDVTND
jgi:hypothetical protein